MEHRYEVTFRVHDGWEYNDPKGYTERIQTVKAANKEDAYVKALRIAAANDKYDETVRKKDVVRLPDPERRKYIVELEFLCHRTIEVIAADPDDAKDAARSLPLNKIFGKRNGGLSIHDLEDDQPIAVYDQDWNEVQRD